MTFCLVPKIGTGPFTDPFRPKYIGDFGGPLDPVPPGPAVTYTSMPYGDEQTYLVGATLTSAQETYLASQGDVFVIPGLDTSVGGNPMLTRVRNFLEGQFIPGSWIVATTTWRQVVGRVGRCCQILQRCNGIGRKVFGPGVQLDTTLTPELLATFVAAGTSLGLATAQLGLAMTVRQSELSLADQLPLFGIEGELF